MRLFCTGVWCRVSRSVISLVGRGAHCTRSCFTVNSHHNSHNSQDSRALSPTHPTAQMRICMATGPCTSLIGKPSAIHTSRPSFPLYTRFIRGAAAVEPLVQLGGDWCFLSASLPKPSLVFAHDRRRRASSAHSHTHSHMSIGTCRTAQPCFGCRAAAHSRVFTPSPLTSV